MAAEALKHLIDSLESFDTKREYVEVLDKHSDVLLDLLREQLAASYDIDGKPRPDAYAALTIEKKTLFASGLGRVIDRVTFYMTGELYNSLRIRFDDDKFYIISTLGDRNIKYEELMYRPDKLGREDRVGLDPQSRKEFAQDVALPEFSRILESLTGIKITI